MTSRLVDNLLGGDSPARENDGRFLHQIVRPGFDDMSDIAPDIGLELLAEAPGPKLCFEIPFALEISVRDETRLWGEGLENT